MKFFRLIFLVAGLGLLALILYHTDLLEVIYWVGRIGAGGLVLVLMIYAVAFACDVVSWQLAFRSIAVDRQWFGRLFLVKLVGEAFNNVLPSASVGGEPVKAVMLKNRYATPYRESAASLVIAKTVNTIGLVIFLLSGFLLLLFSPELLAAWRLTAVAGLIVLVIGTGLFYAVQRYRLASLAGEWLHQRRFGQRLESLLHVIRDFDDHLLTFYTRNRRRFGSALVLALLNWILGVVEIYLVMHLIGYPLGFRECWIIETMAQLVRAGSFFIPAGIGAQEGIFLLLGVAMTGNASLGVAVSIIRRLRELIWILFGLALWGRLPLKNTEFKMQKSEEGGQNIES